MPSVGILPAKTSIANPSDLLQRRKPALTLKVSVPDGLSPNLTIKLNLKLAIQLNPAYIHHWISIKMTTKLPDLTSPDLQSPLRHQSSCASLSLPLLELLNEVLPPPPSLTLSVGSGPGLLEALLLHHFPERAILVPTPNDNNNDNNDHDEQSNEPRYKASFYGVEVRNVNRFLPPANVITVPGTWAVADKQARETEGLLFVYPRQASLVSKYLERGPNIRTVVWIGPRCDLAEFTQPLEGRGAKVDTNTKARLVEDGEVVVVYRRRE